MIIIMICAAVAASAAVADDPVLALKTVRALGAPRAMWSK